MSSAHDITRISFGDPSYPYLLRETPRPPLSLYIKGELPGRGEGLAIVGTRRPGREGPAFAADFAGAAVRSGMVVLSGLAFGIDAAAHRGALEAGGKTIAVLPSGLDRIYPAAHAGLAAAILSEGGALISEYPPGTTPLAYRFLERNRIIASLARATLVIEAPARSGALATARSAAEANRDVFVLPGPSRDPRYAGSHALIREGAILVTCPEDLLADLGLAPVLEDEAPLTTPEAALVLRC